MSSLQNTHREEFAFAKKLAFQAGEIITKYFNSDVGETIKSDSTPLTVADTEINTLVIQSISQSFPKHGIIAEEGSKGSGAEEYEWICDPIDGTIPFTIRLPLSVFSLALYHNKRPVFGILLDPYQNKLYYAFHGSEAYVNDTAIHVKQGKLAMGDVVGINTFIKKGSFYFDCTTISRALNLRQIRTEEIHSICYWSSLIASGKVKGAFLPSAFVWDRAASSIIVASAGGIMADEHGNAFDPFVAPKYLLVSNKDALPEMVQLAKEYLVTA